ncbi:unnamed protein product [Clavelina lepadiformis]|uniref:VWFA domain-containing protein n=1 Tax=Clavelina lepadiformis TaxID=159417 RepID=A0ABP0GM46_CLALP
MGEENESLKVGVETNKADDLLDTKYFCTVEDGKTINVVMKLTGISTTITSRIAQRYVLLIDVSGSMDNQIQSGDPRSLLQRMKVFASLFVETIKTGSWLSIVTFSTNAQIILPMTEMNKLGKAKAKNVIHSLETLGATNLSEGLYKALDATKNINDVITKDCIILFTDGAANEGETDAEKLIVEYQRKMLQLGRKNAVHLATITIGNYQPFLLAEVSTRLGSDAFYWLNVECDFEADMMIPMFLRQVTTLTDINLDLECMDGVSFVDDKISKQHLEERQSDKKAKYFIRILPKEMTKTIAFTLALSENGSELDGKKILDVRKSFFDDNLTERLSADFLLLSLKSMKQVRSKTENLSKLAPDVLDSIDKISAFAVENMKIKSSWEYTEKSYANVLHETGRFTTISALEETRSMFPNLENTHLQNGINSVQQITEDMRSVLGEKNFNFVKVKNDFDDYLLMLGYGLLEIRFYCGQMTAMSSSLATEMPTATDVFHPRIKHPYLPKYVEENLKKYRKIVQRETRIARRSRPSGPIVPQMFIAQNFVFSEALVNKKVGQKQETLEELINRCGGRAVPHVATFLVNTVLVCSEKDFKRESGKVRDALKCKIPIVKESFIHDCIKEKKVVDIEPYKLKLLKVD